MEQKPDGRSLIDTCYESAARCEMQALIADMRGRRSVGYYLRLRAALHRVEAKEIEMNRERRDSARGQS